MARPPCRSFSQSIPGDSAGVLVTHGTLLYRLGDYQQSLSKDPPANTLEIAASPMSFEQSRGHILGDGPRSPRSRDDARGAGSGREDMATGTVEADMSRCASVIHHAHGVYDRSVLYTSQTCGSSKMCRFARDRGCELIYPRKTQIQGRGYPILMSHIASSPKVSIVPRASRTALPAG
ncbi:hypothetical protein BDN67DRAFT_700861 [Paxillus ammoniavirescens]|nr:hypothetical protein BDN67DRAFT_700861 [Paxillus ammoniavirescens]